MRQTKRSCWRSFQRTSVFEAGPPLEHAALLPTPGATLSQLDPLVAVLKIDHADLDHIAGRGRAVFKVDFHPQHEAAGGVKLQLVVVPEPVMFGTVRDGSYRGQFAASTRHGGSRPSGERQQGGGSGVEQVTPGQRCVRLRHETTLEAAPEINSPWQKSSRHSTVPVSCADCVATRSHTPGVLPPLRLVRRAQERSRCSRDFHYRLLRRRSRPTACPCTAGEPQEFATGTLVSRQGIEPRTY